MYFCLYPYFIVSDKSCTMIASIFLVSFFTGHNVLATSENIETIHNAQEVVILKNVIPVAMETADDKLMRFPRGIVPYAIDSASYDELIVSRLHAAMDEVEASSCVVFNQLQFKPSGTMNSSWLHFTNPTEERSCVHQPVMGDNGGIVIVIGFECMTSRNLLHVLLHALGFKDEVTHPHRDQYVRIMWENIQPGYRPLFHVKHEDAPHKLVEYDPMSVMHFHDRAFSINGGPTIMPKVPGLLIAPQDKLSQLDVMKLRLWYGHECNKRKVSVLLDKCKTVFQSKLSALSNYFYGMDPEGVETDRKNEYEYDDYYNNNDDYGDGIENEGNEVATGNDDGEDYSKDIEENDNGEYENSEAYNAGGDYSEDVEGNENERNEVAMGEDDGGDYSEGVDVNANEVFEDATGYDDGGDYDDNVNHKQEGGDAKEKRNEGKPEDVAEKYDEIPFPSVVETGLISEWSSEYNKN